MIQGLVAGLGLESNEWKCPGAGSVTTREGCLVLWTHAVRFIPNFPQFHQGTVEGHFLLCRAFSLNSTAVNSCKFDKLLSSWLKISGLPTQRSEWQTRSPQLHACLRQIRRRAEASRAALSPDISQRMVYLTCVCFHGGIFGSYECNLYFIHVMQT